MNCVLCATEGELEGDKTAPGDKVAYYCWDWWIIIIIIMICIVGCLVMLILCTKLLLNSKPQCSFLEWLQLSPGKMMP